MTSIKVAVRVRPFNECESKGDAKVALLLDGTSVSIKEDPGTDAPTQFKVDHAFWSHDGFAVKEGGERVPESGESKYATQRHVYDAIGQGALESALSGHSSTIIAYGQAGSGKSYTLVGTESNPGLIPTLTQEFFRAQEKKSEERKEVRVSMLEICNEKVRDLLDPEGKPGRKMVITPGHEVEGLASCPVTSYEAFTKELERGLKARTMNGSSPAGHMMVDIRLSRTRSTEERTSGRIKFVELAGRQEPEGKTDTGGAGAGAGDPKEEDAAAAINSSLATLSKVLRDYANLAAGKDKAFIPYRNSTLAKLLDSHLAGAVIIGTVSAADTNRQDTLDTLRFLSLAQAAKPPPPRAETPLDKIIGHLRHRNHHLMAALRDPSTQAPCYCEECKGSSWFRCGVCQGKLLCNGTAVYPYLLTPMATPLSREHPTDMIIRHLREENDRLTAMLTDRLPTPTPSNCVACKNGSWYRCGVCDGNLSCNRCAPRPDAPVIPLQKGACKQEADPPHHPSSPGH